jgi:hypothetical protein
MSDVVLYVIIVFVVLFIIAICLILYQYSKYCPTKCEDGKTLTYYQQQARNQFHNIEGGRESDATKYTNHYLRSVPEKYQDAYDKYMVAMSHSYYGARSDIVSGKMRETLIDIQLGKVYEDDRAEIMDRLYDQIYNPPDLQTKRATAKLKEEFDVVDKGILNKKYNVKKLEIKKPKIISDKQNVHSSGVTQAFSKDYKKLVLYNLGYSNPNINNQSEDDNILNKAIADRRWIMENKADVVQNSNAKRIAIESYEDFCDWISRKKIDGTKDNQKKLNKLEERFKQNGICLNVDTDNKYMRGSGWEEKIYEQDLLGHVYKRASSYEKDDMLNSLYSSLLECFENDNIVCTHGRVEKYLSSMARLDDDRDLGVFKSSDLIKKEMYEYASKTIDNYLGDGKLGPLTPEDRKEFTKSDWKKSESAPKIQEAISLVHDELAKLNEYKKSMSEGTHQSIMLDINNVINDMIV